MGHYNSFLVRVWTEDGENVVRGYIQHVGSREDTHFRDWEKMVGFMLDHLNWHINGRESEVVQQRSVNSQGDEINL